MDANERRQRAAAEAAEWWLRMQGEAARGEREAYVDWLRESSLHVAEMLRIAQVHGALAQFERWESLPTEGGKSEANVVALSAKSPEGERKEPQSSWRLRLAGALAASVLVVAGATTWLLASRHGNLIETPRGERREVALADGSVVQVDPETRLRVDYQPNARHVYLEHGRALFHVAKNPERPFLVQADGTTVRAVGTSFAVEHAAESVVVTVAEGRVAVISPMPPAEPPAAASARLSSRAQARPEILLTANEQLTVEGSGTAEPVHSVDSARALAWAEGRLIFENESVERAVHEFNRYNRIQITVSDPTLAQRRISGVFNGADPESFVAFIQTVAQVQVVRDDSQDIAIEAAK